MAYEDVIAGAPPEVRTFADRLTAWVDTRGWTTEATEKGLKLCTREGLYVCRFSPTKEVVEVDLRRFRRRGLDDLADDVRERLRELLAHEPAPRSMQVPLPAITERWHAFFEDFLRFYVAAVAKAELAGPDPGHLGG